MSTGYEPLAGGAALQKQLDAMVDRASDWEPAFGAVIESFHAIEKERFNANGPGWLPLAEATIAMTGSWARTNQNFDEILQDTGVLMASITSEGEGSYSILTPFSVEAGTTVPYAHWHQTGGFRLHASGAGWPPQRKIVDLDSGAAEVWAAILEGWLMSGEVEMSAL
jgi:phage gpG-like protein